MNDKKSIFTEAKLLASSIASSLDILYEHNVMSTSTVKQYNKSDDVAFQYKRIDTYTLEKYMEDTEKQGLTVSAAPSLSSLSSNYSIANAAASPTGE